MLAVHGQISESLYTRNISATWYKVKQILKPDKPTFWGLLLCYTCTHTVFIYMSP